MSTNPFGGLFFGGWGDYRLWAEHGFQPQSSVESVADTETEAAGLEAPPETTQDIPAHPDPAPDPHPAPGENRSVGTDPDPPGLPLVRPYIRTGGRTRPTQRLGVETLISAHRHVRLDTPRLTADHRLIWLTCQTPQSTAELAARLGLPIGAARVLIADLVDLGAVRVHENRLTAEHRPPLELMIRVRDRLHDLV
ncbi:DUF742 domain-containing protein [Prauserella muralis]|uniref:DUF742 domain-containing protein n=1 Tax=Prauserella muralis TaxID=588067 RepID=UPI0011AC94CB|nr:DUF742 domain-containing protein [Prauserella muralis]TWE28620.1 uncharacterized protein DUF742 [Prauserella muralis]